jgi:hypothetical protein
MSERSSKSYHPHTSVGMYMAPPLAILEAMRYPRRVPFPLLQVA